MEQIKTDICVIGAGSGGLSVAAGAAQMGARVVLIERGEMGGDCLNYGCVPSKALLAAAEAAQAQRDSDGFGVRSVEPDIDFPAVQAHIRDVIAQIAPHDSQERFEGLGVDVIRASAEFTSPKTVRAGDRDITAKRFVIATGSSPAIPPIDGLADVAYLTNETIFNVAEKPAHLMIIGGGPIGCEMAQAHRRLGCKVTLLEMFTIMPKDDPDLVDVVRQKLVGEGINLIEGAGVEKVSREGADILVHTPDGVITGSHVLVAVGRKPNLDGLGLDAAQVKTNRAGVVVDGRLRTSNKKIFALGDVAGGFQFTHQAGYHAGIAIQNLLFRLPTKTNDTSIPWVTYTEPELAQVGLTAAQLMEGDPKGTVLTSSFEGNDRARAGRINHGLVKVMVDRKGKIRGASIVGPHAGELLQPWILAISQNLPIRAMTGFRAPYPTLGEINKTAAGSYYTPTLYSSRTQKLVRLLMKLP
jgi:pyruvate/2-oxoglutarate dehydrogenase complex dihydrolipoamide dehydrogenase (E3) component